MAPRILPSCCCPHCSSSFGIVHASILSSGFCFHSWRQVGVLLGGGRVLHLWQGETQTAHAAREDLLNAGLHCLGCLHGGEEPGGLRSVWHVAQGAVAGTSCSPAAIPKLDIPVLGYQEPDILVWMNITFTINGWLEEGFLFFQTSAFSSTMISQRRFSCLTSMKYDWPTCFPLCAPYPCSYDETREREE